jgi:hypothetical protein
MDPNRVYVWPYAVGGFIGPLVALLFEQWFPSYIALGVAFFIVFATVSVFVARRSGQSVSRAIAASAVGVAVGGFVGFAFHNTFALR